MVQLPGYFKYVNQFMILMHRLGLGAFVSSPQTGHIMILTTTGRRSGQKRPTPVNYAWDGVDAVYCVPVSERAAWFRNLQADPRAEVWIGNAWWTGQAVPVTNADEWLRAYREVLIRSGFAAGYYLGVNPHTATDDELRATGDGIPVVRIQLETRLYGAGGPGDLRWVWPVALGVLGALVIGWRVARD